MSYEEITKELAKAEEVWNNAYDNFLRTHYFLDANYLEVHAALFESKEFKNYDKFNSLEILYRPMSQIVLTEPDGIADVFTIEEFISDCKSYCLLNSDGYGYYGFIDKKSDLPANPSDILSGNIRTDFTHVYWYNK